MPSALDRGWRQEGSQLCTGRTSIHFLMGGNRVYIFSKFILFPVIQEGVYNPCKTVHYSVTVLFIHSVVSLGLTFRSVIS